MLSHPGNLRSSLFQWFHYAQSFHSGAATFTPFHWVGVAKSFQSTKVHIHFTGFVLLGHSREPTFILVLLGSCYSVIPAYPRPCPFHWVCVAQSFRSTKVDDRFTGFVLHSHFRAPTFKPVSLSLCCSVIPEHSCSCPFHWVYTAQLFQGIRVHDHFTGFMLLRHPRAHTSMPFSPGTCCSVIPEHQSSRPFHWVRVAKTFQSIRRACPFHWVRVARSYRITHVRACFTGLM